MTTIIIGYRADIAHPRAALIRYRNLLMVLNALNNQTAFRLTYKIILIEQDTDKVICDDVKALVDDYFWYYCSRPFNRGDAFNVGVGISEAERNDCLCLTDADLLPGETWIEQCLDHMEKAEALIPFQKIMRLSRAGTLQLYCGKRDVDYDKPTGPVTLTGLSNRVTGAYLLADKARTALKVRSGGDGPTITLPARLPDPDVSVIVVEIDDKPVIDRTIRQQADGTISLMYTQATIHGKTPKVETGQIGYWNDAKDSVSWTFRTSKPGKFGVRIVYSCAKGFGGSAFTVSVGKSRIKATTRETGSWRKRAPRDLGTITLDKPGEYTLTVKPKTPPAWKSMGLNSITLRPAK